MKPLLRVGVELATVRYVAAGEPIEGIPRQPVPLAPPEQGVPPCAANLAAETMSHENPPRGHPAHSRGAAQTGHRHRRDRRGQIQGPPPQAAFADLADVLEQSRERPGTGRFPHRSRPPSALAWPCRPGPHLAPPEWIEAFLVQQSVQPLVEGMPAAAANIGDGDPQSLLALPLLSCAHGHAVALWNPIKHFSGFMFYGAGHPQSIRRLLPQAARPATTMTKRFTKM